MMAKLSNHSRNNQAGDIKTDGGETKAQPPNHATEPTPTP